MISLPQTIIKNREISRIFPVYGGDINQCFCLEGKERYFLKINRAQSFPNMFEAEADGLQALKASPLIIPDVLDVGEETGYQYLLLSWLEEGGGTDYMKDFGKKLAQMHRAHNESHFFGWPRCNYIGKLVQENHHCRSWSDFYGQYRIMPMVKRLHRMKYLSRRDRQSAENYCTQLPSIFPPEPPSLLHGDLWSGNFKATPNGTAIFDPAVYYGHREMDLGMTALFGGFPREFYESYDQEYPLEKNLEKRRPHAQFYPLLVHAILFGGLYVERVKNFLKQY